VGAGGCAVLRTQPALIKTYVQAVSQVIVACLVAWSLYFLIDEKRSLTQIGLGAFFCALCTLTRQNMIFLMVFVVLYAFFFFGKKAGWVALLCTGLPFLIMHLIFFPRIMTLWGSWLPKSIQQLFSYYQTLNSGNVEQVWQPDVGMLARLTSFFTAVRYYFIPLIAILLCLITLPHKEAWSSKYERRTTFALLILFIVMFLMHAWASLAKNYCVYCSPTIWLSSSRSLC
jgi:4-amino-4-deoxy-L-arabinose transferase-like glycosyltransferase